MASGPPLAAEISEAEIIGHDEDDGAGHGSSIDLHTSLLDDTGVAGRAVGEPLPQLRRRLRRRRIYFQRGELALHLGRLSASAMAFCRYCTTGLGVPLGTRRHRFELQVIDHADGQTVAPRTRCRLVTASGAILLPSHAAACLAWRARRLPFHVKHRSYRWGVAFACWNIAAPVPR